MCYMCYNCYAWDAEEDEDDHDEDYTMIKGDTVDSFDVQEEFSTEELFDTWYDTTEDYYDVDAAFDGYTPWLGGMAWKYLDSNSVGDRISIGLPGSGSGYITVDGDKLTWKKEAPYAPPRRFTEDDFPLGSMVKHKRLEGLYYLHLVDGWYHLDVRQPDGFRSPRQLSKRAWPQVLEYFTDATQTKMHDDWELVEA